MENTIKKENKLGLKFWLVIWIAGLAGQLVWNIENSWFNTFVYEKIAPNPSIITWMVAISAIVSTFATFLMGTLSDRMGKRRIFILVGYVMWGVTTIVFGLTQFVVGVVGVTAAAVLVIIADAVMSFFGSMGNDCGFNTWTTDMTTPQNRGSLGTALAIQPVIATIAGTLIFAGIISAFDGFYVGDYELDYFMMFVIAGVVIMIIGIVTYFLTKEKEGLKPRKDESFKKSFTRPFNFKLLKNNKVLLYVLLIFMVFFISFNIYFPHILNYFIYGGSKETTEWLSTIIFGSTSAVETVAGGFLAIGLLLGVPLVILSGKYFLNKLNFVPVLYISVALNIIGLLIIFFASLAGVSYAGEVVTIIIGIFFVGSGYMGLYQALMTWIKNLYPEDMRSQFEGVRMIFYVCIPMFLGTLIGNVIVQYMGNEITLEYTTGAITGYAPNYWIFIIAAAVAVLTFIPIILVHKEVKKNPPVYSQE